MAIRGSALAAIVPVSGPAGTTGQSTYQAWLALGNAGSLADFMAAQKGKDGVTQDVSGKLDKTGDASGTSVTPNASAGAGTLARFLAAPNFLGRVAAPGLTLANGALITTQTTPNGSVGEGPSFSNVTRTGGYGQYGNVLHSYYITAPTPAGQFDTSVAGWATHQNLTGGSVFGGWFGANTPSSGKDYNGNPLSEVFSGGEAVGLEINVGNRWADWGLQYTPGARSTTAIKVVPDVLPSSDGPTTAIYPGTYGIAFGQSVHGHKWWVAEYINYDGIMPGGIGYLSQGGSVLSNAPKSAHVLQGYWQTGLDFRGAAFSSAVMAFSSGQVSGTATAGGSGALPGAAAGYIVVTIDGVAVKIPYFAN